MIKRSIAAVVTALVIVPFMGTAAFAADPVDASGATDKVACLFRVYIQEGGESGLDCLD